MKRAGGLESPGDIAPSGEELDRLRRTVSSLHWFHQMEILPGLRTKGVYDPSKRLHELGIPTSLAGKTVLDIGAWDGFYSFLAEQRGARRVVATDSFSWEGPGWGTKEGFLLARRLRGSSVEAVDVDILDLRSAEIGSFDVVFFLGVLYHMRHPLLALEHLFDVTGEVAIVETEVDMVGYGRPAVAFYPGKELGADETNWWGPNAAAVTGMLKAVGFRRVELVTAHSRSWRIARAASRRVRRGDPISQSVRGDRNVFHAWR